MQAQYARVYIRIYKPTLPTEIQATISTGRQLYFGMAVQEYMSFQILLRGAHLCRA